MEILEMFDQEPAPLPVARAYQRHRPEETVLRRVVREHYRTFLAVCEEEGDPLPAGV